MSKHFGKPEFMLGLKGAFEPGSREYSSPFPYGTPQYSAWRAGRAGASRRVNQEVREDPDLAYAPGSYAEYIREAVLRGMVRDLEAEREAEATLQARTVRFHEADTVQDLKAWILSYHPEWVEE